jgi:hypothetical protein
LIHGPAYPILQNPGYKLAHCSFYATLDTPYYGRLS